MKFSDLKKSLQSEVKNAYYLFGKDVFLLNQAQKLIEKKCITNLPDLNITVFNDENFQIQKVLDACFYTPMLNDLRVVVLNDINIDSKSQKLLEKYLQNPNKFTCLIIKNASDFSCYKQISSMCENVDCNYLEEAMLKAIVLNKFSKQKVTLEPLAFKKLVEYCNFDLSYIDLETKKLLNFAGQGGVITAKDVESLVHKNLEYNIFELNNAVAEKNSKKAFVLLDAMLENKESPQSLLVLILSNIRRLFYVSVSKLSDKEIAKNLGVKEYSVTVSKRLAKKFTPKKLKAFLDLGGQVDFDIKNGKCSDKNGIYFFVSNVLLM